MATSGTGHRFTLRLWHSASKQHLQPFQRSVRGQTRPSPRALFCCHHGGCVRLLGHRAVACSLSSSCPTV